MFVLDCGGWPGPSLLLIFMFRFLRSPSLQLRSFSTTARLFVKPSEMEAVNTTERLAGLRQLMKQHKVDIYSTTTFFGPYEMAD